MTRTHNGIFINIIFNAVIIINDAHHYRILYITRRQPYKALTSLSMVARPITNPEIIWWLIGLPALLPLGHYFSQTNFSFKSHVNPRASFAGQEHLFHHNHTFHSGRIQLRVLYFVILQPRNLRHCCRQDFCCRQFFLPIKQCSLGENTLGGVS